MNKKVSLPSKETLSNHWLYIALAIIAIGVAGYAWWFLANHHKIEERIHSPRPEVTNNRHHTAQALLSRSELLRGERGRQAVMDKFGETATASRDILIIHEVGHGDKAHFDKMMGWVEQGGHLVVFSKAILDNDKLMQSEYEQAQNPLMVHLGVSYVKHKQDYFDNKINHQKVNVSAVPFHVGGEMVILQNDKYYQRFGRFVYEDFLKKYPNAQVQNYRIYDESHQLLPTINTTLTTEQKISVGEFLTLGKQEDNSPILFNPDNFIFDVGVGKGRLTILADDEFVINPRHRLTSMSSHHDDKSDTDTNHDWALLTTGEQASSHGYYGGIMAGDNGEFLRLLAGERVAFFVPDMVATDFFTLLWRHLTWTVVGMVLTVGVYLLALPKRFGAVKVYESDGSRNIFGFFGHVGRYLWASDGGEALFAQNRHTLIQSILAKEHMSEPTAVSISQAVSDRTGLSYGMVYEALYGKWADEQEFIRMSRSFARVSGFYKN